MISLATSDDAGARADWTRLIDSVPAARIHADVRWLDVLRRVYRVPGILAFERDASGAVRAGVAGYESRTVRGQRVFHSLRHGLVSLSDEATANLLPAVGDRCRS